MPSACVSLWVSLGFLCGRLRPGPAPLCFPCGGRAPPPRRSKGADRSHPVTTPTFSTPSAPPPRCPLLPSRVPGPSLFPRAPGSKTRRRGHQEAKQDAGDPRRQNKTPGTPGSKTRRRGPRRQNKTPGTPGSKTRRRGPRRQNKTPGTPRKQNKTPGTPGSKTRRRGPQEAKQDAGDPSQGGREGGVLALRRVSVRER